MMYRGRVLTLIGWGESHGCCVGGVLVGVPPGLSVDVDKINLELERRRPGGRLASPRRESDRVEILSGVYKGYTTGAPLAFMIRNRDVKSRFYEEVVRYKPRPGHSDAPARIYSEGFYDYRGAGFYSGRLTAVVVAAASILREVLDRVGVQVVAYLAELGGVECRVDGWVDREAVYSCDTRCPDKGSSEEMIRVLDDARRSGDSIGGVIRVLARGVPVGLGDPVYRLDSMLASQLMAIPGVKGVEIGLGFELSRMRGSSSNDPIILSGGAVGSSGERGGGLLGGHASGPITVRVAVKPTSTIGLEQDTVEWRSLSKSSIRGWGRHDPAIAIRAVPVAESVVSLVLADYILSWAGRMLHYYTLEHGPK